MFKGEYPTAIPVTLGHEFSGLVEAVGAGVSRFSGGELVTIDPNIACGTCSACRNARPNLCERLTAIGVTRDGGFAEYAAVPEAQAFLLPPGLDPVHGAFSEPLACCLHAIDKAKIRTGDSVAILGGGVIGFADGANWQSWKVLAASFSSRGRLRDVRRRLRWARRMRSIRPLWIRLRRSRR